MALGKRWRWDDAPYLTRIIFEVLLGDERGTQTGYGIWSSNMDNDNPIIVVDVSKGKVIVNDPLWVDGEHDSEGARAWTFEEFLKVDPDVVMEVGA